MESGEFGASKVSEFQKRCAKERAFDPSEDKKEDAEKAPKDPP